VPLSRSEAAMFERMMSGSLASVVAVCILAPALEEMLFRGIILRSFLNQYSRWKAILLSAALFGLAHMNLYQFVGGMAVGILLGWIYERSRSVYPCILLHGASNSALTALYFLADAPTESDIWDASIVVWGVSFALAFAGATLLKRFLAPSRKPV